MRIKVSLIAVALMALVSIGSAQQGQGGGGGQRRQGGYGRGGAQRLTQLLRNPQVQEELKLTDDEKTKIEALPRPQRGGPGGGGPGAGGGRPTPPTPEEQAKQLADDKAATSAILTPDQEKRLEELRIQWAGASAATLPDVQDALALTADQKAKIADLQTKMNDANRGLMEKVRNQEMDQAAARTAMTSNSDTFKTEVEKVLTPDQVAKWKTLAGAELKQERRAPGGGR